jgi:hypothetical protein
VPPDAIKAIETWARSNDISRSEAVRRLLEAGLAALVKPKAKSK